MFQIPFNRPAHTGHEDHYVQDSMRSSRLSGDGTYGKKCQELLDTWLHSHTLLTPSCTHALEMAAMLIDIRPGDEVIMPSFTFVSTANAFVVRGATIVFVDIRPDTMNIDETLIEAAITSRTRAIVPVHYAGVSCDMNVINALAAKYRIRVVEDAAQGVMSRYHGRYLGTLGALGAFSFHETKNITSGGEGGAIIVNDSELMTRAEIIREKGTNRSLFFRGQVDKYTWVDVGSSYLPSELQAAYLWGQLEHRADIMANRMATWQRYYAGLAELASLGVLSLPVVPADCEHNAHMFYIKVEDLDQRTRLIEHLAKAQIQATFHYVPLHSAPAGKRYGRFEGTDRWTTTESERLFRLPLYYGMRSHETDLVIEHIFKFFGRSSLRSGN